MKLQFNPSTGKLSYNVTTGKVQTVTTPTTPGPRDTVPGNNCGCFDSGVSPRFYTMVFDGVQSCPTRDVSAINGTFKLEIVDIYESVCYYLYSGDGIEISFYLDLNPPGSDPYVRLYAKVPGAFIFYYTDTIGPACDYICADSISNSITLADCSGFKHGYDGTATWNPYWYEPWAESTGYVVGDSVSLSSEFYICLQDHTSCSTCPGVDKPGLGSDWENYWMVPTDEC